MNPYLALHWRLSSDSPIFTTELDVTQHTVPNHFVLKLIKDRTSKCKFILNTFLLGNMLNHLASKCLLIVLDRRVCMRGRGVYPTVTRMRPTEQPAAPVPDAVDGRDQVGRTKDTAAFA